MPKKKQKKSSIMQNVTLKVQSADNDELTGSEMRTEDGKLYFSTGGGCLVDQELSVGDLDLLIELLEAGKTLLKEV